MARQTILEQRRIEKCWTQQELAQRAGVAISTISRAETLNSKPYIRTLKRIARALGVPVSQAGKLQEYRFPL